MTADRVRPADRADLDGRGRPSPPDDLRRRLDNLPPGHPSSPRETDGTPRDPTPRIRDLDAEADLDDYPQADKPGPYTDADWAEHRAEVPARLDEAREQGLSTLKQFGLDKDGEAWVLSRSEIHKTIIDDLYGRAAHVPCDHQAIIAGGLAGAGKTTVLGGHAGIDRSQYLTVNPDDIKEELAERGLIPKVEGLSPMEASDLVHEESSYLARQLAMRAQADGKNLIWDITMSSRESTEKRVTDLRADDYASVTGIFVDIPIEVSVARADARHRDGEDGYLAGKSLGGRFVPPELITSRVDERWGSQNRRIFEELKSNFDQWTLFDNGVDHRDPVRIADGLRNRDDPQEAAT